MAEKHECEHGSDYCFVEGLLSGGTAQVLKVREPNDSKRAENLELLLSGDM